MRSSRSATRSPPAAARCDHFHYTCMTRTPRRLPLTLPILAVVVCFAGHALAQPAINPAAAALADFTKRLNAYMDIHKKEESQIPEVKKGATPAEVMAFEKGLGERIRAARAEAKPGD